MDPSHSSHRTPPSTQNTALDLFLHVTKDQLVNRASFSPTLVFTYLSSWKSFLWIECDIRQSNWTNSSQTPSLYTLLALKPWTSLFPRAPLGPLWATPVILPAPCLQLQPTTEEVTSKSTYLTSSMPESAPIQSMITRHHLTPQHEPNRQHLQIIHFWCPRICNDGNNAHLFLFKMRFQESQCYCFNTEED